MFDVERRTVPCFSETDNFRKLIAILSPNKTGGNGTTENMFTQNEGSESLVNRLLSLANENREVYNGNDTDVEVFLGLIRNPKDYLKYAADIGKRTDLTIKDKVRRLQKAFDGLKDKTDIMCPKDPKYVKGINERGKVNYSWPPYLGFDLNSIQAVTLKNIPELWIRIGSMTGANFTTYPEHADYYTYDELSLPYKENPQAQHAGTLFSSRYFKAIDAIAEKNFNGLNAILKSNGKAPLLVDEFDRICGRYQKYLIDIEVINKVKGNIGTKYGLIGQVGSYDAMPGGAAQFLTPLDCITLMRLGLIDEI